MMSRRPSTDDLGADLAMDEPEAAARLLSPGFVRISPEQIVQIIVTLNNWQRSHRCGKDDLVGARSELDICPEERLELRRCRLAIVSAVGAVPSGCP